MNQTLGNLNWNDPATIIAFAVDNNPTGVAAAMEDRDYDIQGLEIDQYKDLLMEAYNAGLDLSWIGKLNFNPGMGNWTGEMFRKLQSNTTSKVTVQNIGDALVILGSTLGALFGVKPPTSSGTTQNSPVPTSETIMGIDKDIFWPLAFILLIVIALVLYLVLRKK